MIRRKRLVSSIMAGVMSGLLVVGNIAAFPGNIMAQEDDSVQVRSIYTAVRILTVTRIIISHLTRVTQ